MISIKIISTPKAIANLREKAPQIIAAITRKMDELMIRLQSRVVSESIPEFFPNGAPNIASTVQFVPAHLEGNAIVGAVTAGGPKTTKITLKSGAQVDYAGVQEYGVAHGWTIEPFNKQALAFMLDGRHLIRKRVFHPPLESRPFMRSELQNMESQIVSELKEAFAEAITN